MSPLRVLLIDDDPLQFAILKKYFSLLKNPPYVLEWEATFSAAQQAIGQNAHDIYLVDYHLGEHKGTDLIKEAIAQGCQAPMILLTASEDSTVDEAALEAGAVDFLVKTQINETLLNRSIRYARERKKVEQSLQQSYETIKRQQKILEEELEQARITQSSILPQNIPQHESFRLAIQYVPMNQIGGDFYDFLQFHDKKISLFMADVTGHGVSAALLSFMVSGLFKTFAVEHFPPKFVLKRLNDALYNKMPENKYATAFYGVYDIAARSLTYASAGHPPGYIIRSAREIIALSGSSGFPLGIFTGEAADYEEHTIPLVPGDKLFLYTDGIVEIQNTEQEMFGWSRLEQCLQENAHLLPEELLAMTHDKVLAFSRQTEFDDDITLCAMEVQ